MAAQNMVRLINQLHSEFQKALMRVTTWQSPENLFRCDQFEGQRPDLGLIEVEICKPYDGKGYSTA
jgi:hypothetical protein